MVRTELYKCGLVFGQISVVLCPEELRVGVLQDLSMGPMSFMPVVHCVFGGPSR